MLLDKVKRNLFSQNDFYKLFNSLNVGDMVKSLHLDLCVKFKRNLSNGIRIKLYGNT